MEALAGGCDRIAALLTYPDDAYLATAAEARALLEPEHCAAAQQVAAFLGRVDALDVEELRELFTITFDLNPVCSLEVGWHLHGETYDRGEFLVRARRLLRAAGVEESRELPDHLAQLLRALPRLDAAEARDLATTALLPALGKMQAALAARHNPFEHVLSAACCLVAGDPPLAAEGDRTPGRPVPVPEKTT